MNTHAPGEGRARKIVVHMMLSLDGRFEGPDHDLSFWRAMYRLTSPGVYTIDSTGSARVPGDVFGDPRLVRPRVGQQSFQALVLDAYSRRCAVTQEEIRPVLQAAHIRPVAEGGEHRLDNGMLLRSAVHTLFDRGYLAVDLDYRLRVSLQIREEFDNGDDYYALGRTLVRLPERRADRPRREFLEWHNDVVFRS